MTYSFPTRRSSDLEHQGNVFLIVELVESFIEGRWNCLLQKVDAVACGRRVRGRRGRAVCRNLAKDAVAPRGHPITHLTRPRPQLAVLLPLGVPRELGVGYLIDRQVLQHTWYIGPIEAIPIATDVAGDMHHVRQMVGIIDVIEPVLELRRDVHENDEYVASHQLTSFARRAVPRSSSLRRKCGVSRRSDAAAVDMIGTPFTIFKRAAMYRCDFWGASA